MKLLKITPFLSASAVIALLACGKKEDKEAQIPPPPPPVAEPVEAPSEPDLKPIQSVTEPSAGQFSLGGTNAPSSSGHYVIQVDIKPSQKAADKVLEKLRGNGIEAYVAEVEDPGELEGTYYRVRIGFFGTIADATNYAKNTLAPLGYAWWVDNKKNDAVGNPGGDDSEYQDYGSSDSEPTPASDWSQPAAPDPAPAPEPEPMPQPQPEPEPAPAPAPAATQAPPPPPPAPAAEPQAPAAADDDEWQ